MTIAEIMASPDPLKAFAADRLKPVQELSQKDFDEYMRNHLLSRGAAVGSA